MSNGLHALFMQDGMSPEMCQNVHCTGWRKWLSVLRRGPETSRDVIKHE